MRPAKLLTPRKEGHLLRQHRVGASTVLTSGTLWSLTWFSGPANTDQERKKAGLDNVAPAAASKSQQQ